MRRVTTTLALALCLLGCAPSGDPVQLLTSAEPFEKNDCLTYFTVGQLVIDTKYGTAVDEDTQEGTKPVMWRPGFTGSAGRVRGRGA